MAHASILTWTTLGKTSLSRILNACLHQAQYSEVVEDLLISRSEKQAEQSRKIAQPGQAPPRRTAAGVKMIAAISRKGGVGRSTVSINLAHSLARFGQGSRAGSVLKKMRLCSVKSLRIL